MENDPVVNTVWVEKEVDELGVTKREAKQLRAWYLSFVWAAISGTTAICYAQPFSLLKTRMYIYVKDPNRNTVRGELKYLLKNKGIHGLYKGLSANLLRQMIYTGSRIGIFFSIIDFVKRDKHVSSIKFWDRFAYGLASGAIAAVMSVPMEVAFVRMAADDRLPEQFRRRYHNVADALYTVFQLEGFKSLWVGAGPSLLKGMLQNAISLGLYTELKVRIREKNIFSRDKRDWRTIASAATLSGAISAVLISPFDLIKIRSQTAPFMLHNPHPRKSHSTNMIRTIKYIWSKEGFKPFYHGIIPQTLYLIPFTTSLFLCFEQMRSLGIVKDCPEQQTELEKFVGYIRSFW